jgi:hypothetical protein
LLKKPWKDFFSILLEKQSRRVMMVGAIVITHGSLAASLMEVAESITGRIRRSRPCRS